MAQSLAEIEDDALKVSEEDRARLADLLFASLPDEAEEPLDQAWDQEIQRRMKAVESGTAKLASAVDVHAEARKIYQR